MKVSFTSLFSKVFAAITAVVLLYFVSIHFILVPLIRHTLAVEEEAIALTLLDTVSEIIQKTKTDLDSYRNATLEARKKQLKDVVTLMETFLRRQVELRIAHGEPREEVLEELFEELRNSKYGDNDYFFVLDYDSHLLSHPDPRLHKSDYSQANDVRGNRIVPPMVEIARRDGEGFHTYWFNRLGRNTPSEKLSFVRHMPDFAIVLGSGLYLDDVADTVAFRQVKAFSALREKLQSIRIAKTGYVFVFDQSNRLIIHPNPLLEGESLCDKIDPISGSSLAERFREVIDEREGVRYRWSRMDSPERHQDDMIAWVRHFKEYDWYVTTSIYLNDLYENSEVLAQRLRWFSLVALLVLLMLGYWLVRWMTAPLENLVTTVAKVESGDLTARCLVGRHDEIGVLTQAFNAMVDRLQASIRTLDDKVRERTLSLERAVDELRVLDRLKSDFISSVSHELRTPLTAIMGFARLQHRLLERVLALPSDPNFVKAVVKARDNVQIILGESDRLAKRIDAVLELTQLESKKIIFNYDVIDLESWLKALEEGWQPVCQAKGLTWQLVDLVESKEPFRVDSVRLRQILDHLLDNAVKFTQAGQIVVTIKRVESLLEVTIQDSGVGIPEERQEKIFEKFNQSGEILVDKPTGIGLGLPISRLLATLQDGRLDLVSSTVQGSLFRLTLPVR
ncbi:MAG: cache domain-containing protein [Magnetococcales bacterium]|nr:cache domain-containing protein [Magnetococcales bacterium]MBF0438126.1 cache domain-containing protein [Magnetococcales bacterium]